MSVRHKLEKKTKSELRMPSLVAQAIGKSKASGQQKTAKPADAPPASTTKKKSLQALAMEKATKKSTTSPVAAPRQVDTYTSPQETRVLPVRSEDVTTTPRARTEPRASREKTPRAAASYEEQRPAEQVLQTVSSSIREVDEQDIRGPASESTVSRSSRKEKSRRSRARTASDGEDVDESINAIPKETGKSQFSSIIFRLIVALVCGVTLYFGQSFIQPPLELPSTYRQLQLGQGSGPSMRNLLKESAGDIGDIEKFRNGLIDALKDKYSEDVSVEQLWDTYVQLKRSNSLMAAALGAAVGFAFATALA